MHRDMRHQSGGVGARDRFYSHGMESMSSLSSFGEDRSRSYQDRFRNRMEPERPRIEEKLDFKRELPKKQENWDRELDRVGRDRNIDRGRDMGRLEDSRDRGSRELNNRDRTDRGRELSRERGREHEERSRERMDHRERSRERRDRSRDRRGSSRGHEDIKRRRKDHDAVQRKEPSNTFRSDYEGMPTTKKDPDDRIERLEKMVQKLVKGSSEDVAGGEPKPGEFNPRNTSFPTSLWLNHINEECLQRNLDDRECINFIQSRMTGIIKAWFKTLGLYDYTWLELKMLITRTFPDNIDFAQTLRLLVDRVKAPDETITQYYFSKMYLLEACKISGVNAVSCLIDGLDNPYWQAEARTNNFMTPEILYSQFLCNLPNHGMQVPIQVSSPVSHMSYEREVREPREHRKERDSKIEPNKQNMRKCYTCGKIGHIATECRHAPICYNCNNKGHIAIKCPRK